MPYPKNTFFFCLFVVDVVEESDKRQEYRESGMHFFHHSSSKTWNNFQCLWFGICKIYKIKHKKVQISHFLSKVLLSSLVTDDRSKIDDCPFNSYWVSFIFLSFCEFLLPPSKACARALMISKTKMILRQFAVLCVDDDSRHRSHFDSKLRRHENVFCFCVIFHINGKW